MSNLQRQIRRDTTANIAAYTPAQGELGYDTVRGNLVAGDGATAGGGSLFPPFKGGTSWTPTLAGSGTAGSPTYTVQAGIYVKLGPLVIAWFNVAISAVGGMVGSVEVGGLPFAALAAPGGNILYGGAVEELDGITFDSGYTQAALEIPGGGGSYALLIESGSNKSAQNIAAANFAATSGLRGCLKYLTSF